MKNIRDETNKKWYHSINGMHKINNMVGRMMDRNAKSDFSKDAVWKKIITLAIPMSLAQIVQVCYNVIDRIYIGHLAESSSLALTGLGLTFPLITIILAFTNLFGTGGVPLFSIARGKGDDNRADEIMGNTFSLLLLSSVVIMAFFYIVLKPALFLFGASDATYPFAKEYMLIYLLGTLFSMVGTGMNGFINAQGFGKVGMLSILLGAIMNIILDPIFIFLLHMGIQGAATATIISQACSAIWVVHFLLGKKTLHRIKWKCMRLHMKMVREISALGMAGFFMGATSGAVQIACNSMLHLYGGDLYVGIMTILNSVRDMIQLPVSGLGAATQPVLGYNYGAGEYKRVKQGMRFAITLCFVYMFFAWIIVMQFPGFFIRIFNSDPDMIIAGAAAVKIYYFGLFVMALQFSGQAIFIGLGQSKYAAFFSLFRKLIIVIPLTLLLPRIGLGVNGVFWAEPASNLIGGVACFTMMILRTRYLLRDEPMKSNQKTLQESTGNV